MDNLTDNQFTKLFEKWREQNNLKVTLCEPRGKPRDLAFYLQFNNVEDYLKAFTYFERERVYLLQCSVNATRLQVYQWIPQREKDKKAND